MLELLEDRVAPAVIDLTTPGAMAVVNGAILSQFTAQPAGSGSFHSFVRLSSSNAVEQGYNTDFRPVQFDENTSFSFTHSLQLGAVPTIIAPGGMAYYEFALDINSSSLLSLDELRLYVTKNSTAADPQNALSHYDATTLTLTGVSSTSHTPVSLSPAYDMDGGADPSDLTWVKLNPNLSPGIGKVDMVALIPVTLLGSDPNQYVYLYSKFGVQNANTGGFQQWAAQPALLSLASISGTKFEDVTGNGFSSDDPVLNAANPDFVPVTVQLFQGSTLVATTTTDSSGQYSFSVVPGTYTIREVVPNGWFETAARTTTITVGSGVASTGNDFDDFLVAKLNSAGTILTVRALPALPSKLRIAQAPQAPPATTNVFLKGPETNNVDLQVGTFNAPNLQSIQVISAGSYIVDTTGVHSTPVELHVPQGDQTLMGGNSGTTADLNIGSNVSISVTGGVNTLNFAPTQFGINFNAGIQNQAQSLDSTGTHNLSISGTFQNIVGTNFNDTLFAAVPAFDPTTMTIGPGTNITEGVGQDKVFGTLATTVMEPGASSQFTQTLGAAALGVLDQVGTSATMLNELRSTVNMTGGNSSAQAGVLTNLTLGGTNNQFVQSIDSGTEAELASLIQRFDNTSASSGQFSATGTASLVNNFSNTLSIPNGFSQAQIGLFTNLSLAGGHNAYTEALDPNAVNLITSVVNGFNATAAASVTSQFSPTATAKVLNSFNNTVVLNNGFSTAQASVLTNLTMYGGNNTYIGQLDPNAVNLVSSVVNGFNATAAASVTSQFSPTATAKVLNSFNNTVVLNNGFNTAEASVFTNLTMTGGNSTYIGQFDPNAVNLVSSVVNGFNATAASSVTSQFSPTATAKVLNSFNNTVVLNNGFNTAEASVLNNLTMTGGNSTYIGQFDSNAVNLVSSVVNGFNNTAASSVTSQFSPTATAQVVASFDSTVSMNNGSNKAAASILTNLTMEGGNGLYVARLDSTAANLVSSVVNGFNNTASKLTSQFSSTATAAVVNSFGSTVSMKNGFNTAVSGILTHITMDTGHNTYIGLLDPTRSDGTVDTTATDLVASEVNSFSTTNRTVSNGFSATANAQVLNSFDNTISMTGGNNAAETGLLTQLTADGGHNLYFEALDDANLNLVTSLTHGLNAADTVTMLGSFETVVSLTGGSNQARSDVLTNVTLAGGLGFYLGAQDQSAAGSGTTDFERFAPFAAFGSTPASFATLDTESATLVTTVVHGFNGPDTASVLNAFAGRAFLSGGYDTLDAGLLTNAQFSGNNEVVTEQMSQTQLDGLTTTLAGFADGGTSELSTVAAAYGLNVTLGAGNDEVVGGLLGTFTTGTGNSQFVAEDPSLLGALTVSPTLLQFGGTFNSGAGSNTFYFVGTTLGHVAVNESTSSDTLDFSNLYKIVGTSIIPSSSINLNLGVSAEQQVVPGNLWLTLSNPAVVGQVVGNGSNNTIQGGSSPVTIYGAAPLDDRTTNPPPLQPHQQVVFLDFNTYTTAGKHVYTTGPTGEQQAILNLLAADYAAFDYVFTLTQPASGPYFTVFFNKTPIVNGTPQPGGLSDKIDFRDLNQSATAAIDVNGLLGQPGEPPADSADFVAMSATIAAHELGHMSGERHTDAFGPIGFGIHNAPGVNQYLPNYPGAQGAWQTTSDIMASPASVGSSLFDAVDHSYFGARDDIKLAFIEDGTVLPEQTDNGLNTNTSMANAQPLGLLGNLNLPTLAVPNTIARGFDAGKTFSVAAADVTGSIQLDSTGHSESDFYSFQGRAGDLINIQTMSNALTRITDPVDTILRVYGPDGKLVSYYGTPAVNNVDFEGSDAIITDLTLPTNGTYTVEVDTMTSADQLAGDPRTDPRAASDAETGHYEMLIYRFQAGNAIPAGGSNDTFIAGSGPETLIGRGGNDTVQDSGAAVYTLVDGHLTGSGTDTLQNIHNAVLTGGAGGTTFNVSGWTGTATLIGAGGVNTVVVNRDTNFTLTANTLTLANGGTFNLVNIQNVLLTGGPSGSIFDVGGWNGSATLTGVGGVNIVVASRAANFVLTDSALTVSGGGAFNLVNIHNAQLTGGVSGSTFDVRGWTGTDTLNSQGGTNPVLTPRGVAVSTTEGPTTNAVANLTDGGSTVASYTAAIDWGDGSPRSVGTSSASGQVVTTMGTHFYNEEGNYTVTTTISQGTAFNVIVSSSAVVTDAPLTALQLLPVNPTEGNSTGAVALATFTDPGGSEAISDYQAIINWGDATATSAGTIVDNGNGHFSVKSSHVYADEGNFVLSVSVTHDNLPSQSVSGGVSVGDAALVASGSSFLPSQGIALNNLRVATFADGNPLGKISDFAASISWGDGGSSTGAVSQPGGPGTSFVVTGNHTYSVPGSETVQVTIVDVGGQTASASYVVTVGPSVFVLNSTQLSGALTLSGAVSVNIGGAVVVDSTSPSALSAGGNSQITASQILVAGGVSAAGGAILSPTPATGVAPLPDPLAGLPIPPSDVMRGAVNLSKGPPQTILPGIYTQIAVSGSVSLTLSPGVYIIKGGGLSVSNTASISGTGVTIYLAGSNFPSAGGTFGAISLSSSGTVNLAAPTSGTYAGVLLFQARDNGLDVSLTSHAAVGLSGTIYAPKALLNLSGGGQLNAAAIVNQLRFTGNGGSALSVEGSSPTTGTAGHLVAHNLYVYVANPQGSFSAGELARIHDAIQGVNAVVTPYGVSVRQVRGRAAANLVVDIGSSSASGGQASGVLGSFDSSSVVPEITLISGWQWYTGPNPGTIQPGQYDFQTVVTHELGHALGLGHNPYVNSVMHATLGTGVARRALTVRDLNIPDVSSGPDALHASQDLASGYSLLVDAGPSAFQAATPAANENNQDTASVYTAHWGAMRGSQTATNLQGDGLDTARYPSESTFADASADSWAPWLSHMNMPVSTIASRARAADLFFAGLRR
jgi:hypothetical protein